MITNMKKLTGGNSQVEVCEGVDQIEFSVHGVKNVILSKIDGQKDEVFGDVYVRSLYVTHEIEVNGHKELRRVKFLLFGDDPGSVKMNRGDIVTHIKESSRLQTELNKKNKGEQSG